MISILIWICAGAIAGCLVERSIRTRNAMAYAGYPKTIGMRRRE